MKNSSNPPHKSPLSLEQALEEISRINNELINLKRELDKKNLELEELNTRYLHTLHRHESTIQQLELTKTLLEEEKYHRKRLEELHHSNE